MSGTVDLRVDAPADTTDVRFYLDGIQLSELTNQYARLTRQPPIWMTAFDASWFRPGPHVLRAVAQTPEGTVAATRKIILQSSTPPTGTTSLDGAWRFASANELPYGAEEGANPAAAQDGFDDSRWAAIVVPDSLGAVDQRWMKPDGLLGVYRRTFHADHLGKSQRLFLISDSCYWACRYFVNGTEVATSHGGYLPRRIDITSAAHKGKNTLAIIVDSRAATMGVFNRLRYYYWNYTGLLEDVSLQVTSDVELTQFRAQGTAEGALTLYPFGVNTTGQAQNVVVAVSVTGPDGQIAARPQTFSTTLPPGGGAAAPIHLTVNHPQLWDLDHPNLYTVHLKATGLHGSQPLAERTGFRDITIHGPELYLNGKPIDDLQGFDRHADYPGLGRTQPAGLADREIKLLHDKGFRIFRPAHYPTTPAELDAADKYGMLVLEEINVTGMSGKELASPDVISFARSQLKREIDRDRSHPSIFAWSVGNENRTDQPGSPAYISNVIAYGRQLDPTRPFTEVSAVLTHDICYRYEDFVAMNYYAGWYVESMTGIDAEVNKVQQYAGNKPILISEYGAGAVRGRPGFGPGTEYYQARVIDAYNAQLNHRPHFIGKFYWTSTEFLVGPDWSGGMPRPVAPFHVKGLLTYYRQPKLGWRVIFSPVRMDPIAPITAPAGNSVSVVEHVVVHDVRGHGASGVILATPPEGFTVTPVKQPFSVPPSGTTTLDLTLTGRIPSSTKIEPGMVRAVINSQTEALPQLIQVEPQTQEGTK